MKKIYFLVVALFFFNGLKAQIVNISDANFMAKLLAANSSNYIAKNLSGGSFKIDSNNDGQIQETEALQVSALYLSNSQISDLKGINSFINLNTLHCYDNQLTSLDLFGLENLDAVQCYRNQLSSLNISSSTKLKYLECWSNKILSLDIKSLTKLVNINCSSNQIAALDLNNLVNLVVLQCSSNQLETLDASNLLNVKSIDCSNNQLTSLFIKNGVNECIGGGRGFDNNLFFSNNPALQYICADDVQITQVQNLITQNGNTNCHVNSYCSFIPGGIKFIIQGNQKLDSNNNGCDSNDFSVPNFKYVITNSTTTGSIISDNSGNYSIPVQAGTYTIIPALENLSYFTISPTTVNVTFPTQTTPFTQNFCITANGVRPDLEVTLLPLRPARPGFDAKYKLVYKNKGNTIQSGSVNLTFDDAVLDLVFANPVISTETVNNLSWDFLDLKPFETREITFTLNVNSPIEIPAMNNGDILTYVATITSVATDEISNDNSFTFNQTLVNSFDPNDKTCLEGTTISPSLIGQYVHYMIRFENNGTANAQNIVVKDMIDLSKFDISTLVPTNASHSFVTNISAGNKVEFIFENINLPFDDANNDGYIAFKIKTLPTLMVGDTFTNDANIYFDYNFPIITNKATSTFKTLGIQDFEFSNYFTLYPNPVKSVLSISSKEPIVVKSISIYNTLGQLVLVVPNADKVSKIDVSSLKTGNYFIKINSDKGMSNTQFIKE